MSITQWTATRLNQALKEKEVSSQEVWQAYQDQIAKGQTTLNIYNHVAHEPALGALAPIALKDNLCTQAVPTTCSSRILQGFVPPYDATVVQRLKQAGVMSLGKTNLDEFAMGSSNENSARGPVRNPWDPARVPGGSSGGSAAAVAAQMAPWALGSDTGGSVRLPAAFCGVVGMKPTYGLVSRYGLVAFASSLDQIGPLTRDVRDCAELLNLIAGPDPLDSTCLPDPRPDYTASLAKPVAGLTLGVPREMMADGVQPDVKRAVEAAIRTYEELGAKVEFTTLPHTAYALAIYYLIATAEASSNLARYDGIRYGYRTEAAKDLTSLYTRTRSEGFGWEVKRRIMLGTYALSAGYYDAYYKKAQQGRTLILRDFEAAFSRYDLLLSPTAPVTAFPIGEKVHDPMQLYLVDICTVMANLAGIPAISLPCGFDQNGLPIGLQLMGPALSEARVLQAAFAFEQATDFRRLPSVN